MNIFKKITAGTLALVLATGIAGSALAEQVPTQGDVSVNIFQKEEDAILSASIGNLGLGQHQYSTEDETATGTVAIVATDYRGTADGWTVTVAGSDFNDGLEIDNLTLGAGEVTTVSPTGHISEVQPVQQGVSSWVATGQPVLTAKPGTGAGQYTSTYNAELNIPAGTLVGDYETTLTVTISGNSPGVSDTAGSGN